MVWVVCLLVVATPCSCELCFLFLGWVCWVGGFGDLDCNWLVAHGYFCFSARGWTMSGYSFSLKDFLGNVCMLCSLVKWILMDCPFLCRPCVASMCVSGCVCVRPTIDRPGGTWISNGLVGLCCGWGGWGFGALMHLTTHTRMSWCISNECL